MKKWKKCPLLIVTAISMLLVSGVALAGTKGAYKEYNKDWPKVPAVAGMMQASKASVDEVLYVPAALALHQRPGVPGIRSTFGRQRKKQQKQLQIRRQKRIRLILLPM